MNRRKLLSIFGAGGAAVVTEIATGPTYLFAHPHPVADMAAFPTGQAAADAVNRSRGFGLAPIKNEGASVTYDCCEHWVMTDWGGSL